MSRPQSAVGLDIGSHSVKVVRLVRRLGRTDMVSAEILRLPEAAGERDEIIQRFLDTKELTGDPSGICISGRAVMLNPIELRDNDPRTVDQVAEMEIQRLDDLAEQDMISDYVKLPEDTGRRGLLLGMTRPQLITAALHVPDALGMDIRAIVPTAVALFNGSVAADASSPGVVVCADMGHSATHVAVGNGSGILFARRFELGGASFNAAICEAMGVSDREAEDLKMREGGVLAQAHPGGQAAEVIKQAADAWIEELIATLSFFRERFSGGSEAPSSLVLTGGGAELDGLLGYAASKLDLEPREPAFRWKRKMTARPERFAVATGLALAVLGRGCVGMNLLPDPRKQALMLRATKKYWAGIGLVASLIFATGLAGSYVGYLRKQVYVESASRQLGAFQAMDAELGKLVRGNAQLNDRLRFAHRGIRDGGILRDVAGALAEAKDAQDWIVLVADSATYFGGRKRVGREPAAASSDITGTPASVRGAMGASPPAKTAPGSFLEGVIVEGYTPKEDFSTVLTTIEKLRQVPYIESVDLLTDDRVVPNPGRTQMWDRVEARLFAIEIKVRES